LFVISPDQKWRIVPSRRVNVEGRDFGAIWQEAEIIARIGAVEIAIEAKVAPAALLFPGDQALEWRARDDGERDPLADVGRIALPCAQCIGAHRARTRALGPEHVAIDAEGLLVAEQPGEIGRAVFAFKAVVADHRAARRQRAALGGDALDMATQFDLLGEQRGAGGAIFGAFIGDSDRVDASELGGGLQGLGLVHGLPLRGDGSRVEHGGRIA